MLGHACGLWTGLRRAPVLVQFCFMVAPNSRPKRSSRRPLVAPLRSYGVQYVDIVSNPENYREKEENQRRKRMKTAMGAQKWLDLESFEDTGQCAQQLKDEVKQKYFAKVSCAMTPPASLFVL